MRKAIAGLILLGLVAAAVFLLKDWLFPPFSEKLFPRDTLFYVFIPDLKEGTEALKQTELWKQMDRSETLKPQMQVDRLLVLLESYTAMDLRPLLEQMTRDAAAGIFPATSQKRGGAFSFYVKSTGETSRILNEQIDPAFRRRVPDLEKVTVKRAGITYYKYSSSQFPPGFSPCYFIDHHHLVIGVSATSLDLLIDVLDGKTPPLRKSESFDRARKSVDYNRKGLLAYANLQKGIDLLGTALPAGVKSIWPGLVKIIGVDAVESFGYTSQINAGGFAETGFVTVVPNRGGLLKIYLDQPPAEMQALGNIPGDATVVTAGTLADFPRIWDEINSVVSLLGPGQLDRWKQTEEFINGVLNFNIRHDLLEPLGNQFCLAYQPAAQSPSALLAVSLKKPGDLQTTMDRLAGLAVAAGGFKRSEETYQGKKLIVLHPASGSGGSPSFYFNGSWLYFSTDIEPLKKAISSTQKSSVLAQDDFRRVTAGFPSKVNGFSYTRVSSYLEQAVSAFGSQADPKAQRDAKQIAEGLFGAAGYVIFQKDGVYFHSYSSVPNAFLVFPALLTSYKEFGARRPF